MDRGFTNYLFESGISVEEYEGLLVTERIKLRTSYDSLLVRSPPIVPASKFTFKSHFSPAIKF
jgi:hypothetical protein